MYHTRDSTKPTASTSASGHTVFAPKTARRYDRMALSSIMHPTIPGTHYATAHRHESVQQDRVPRGPHPPYVAYSAYSHPVPATEGYRHYELFQEGHCHSYHRRNESGDDSPSYRRTSSTTSTFSSPSTSRSNELPTEELTQKAVSRSSRSYRAKLEDGFGLLKNGKFYCTYVHEATQKLCVTWEDGYTGWHDLARHADADHGPGEVDLIDQGVLDFKSAQWVKTEDHMNAIKKTMLSMVCRACGKKFASNRSDSIDRHVRNGACARAQERLRSKPNCTSVYKKKGGKTAAEHTRR